MKYIFLFFGILGSLCMIGVWAQNNNSVSVIQEMTAPVSSTVVI
ncbi:MAG: hypothetical protein ABSD46_02320 [Bacteroidota bacterium]